MASTNTRSTQKTDKPATREIAALAVTSVGKQFRRIGLGFTQEPTYLDPKALTEQQMETLKNEQGLRIVGERITVADRGDAKPATPVVFPVPAPAADDAE